MAYSLQTKKEVVDKIHQGTNIAKVAAMYGVSRQSIINWTRSPEKYLSETRQAHTPFDLEEKVRILRMMELSGQGQVPVNTGITISPGEEVPSVSTPDDKDTKQHIRGLKEENEYLKARVAYLEALMELNGTPVSELKKKRNTRPSTKSSETGSEQ